MTVHYYVKESEKIFLPSHKRTCYFNFGYPRGLYKYPLVLPDMELYLYSFKDESKKDCAAIYYYPIKDGKKCVSPFLNTTDNGCVCAGDLYKNVQSTDEAVKVIYTTVWSEAALFSYVKYLKDGYSMHNYKLFVENWSKTGKIDLIYE